MNDWGPESFALDDNVAPMPMECDVCGTNDFYLESGFYYCTLCNTQSQQTREYVDEQDFAPDRQFNIRRTGMLKDRNRRLTVKHKDQKILLSSWEVHNLIIKAMTTKLIELGFPPVLKSKVFQIWSFYLTKRQAVFCSPGNKLGCAASLMEPKLNLYALHAFQRKKRIMPKRLKTISSQEPTEDLDMEALSVSKRKKSMLKRKAMETEYRLQAATKSKEDDAYDVINEGNLEDAQPIVEPAHPPIHLTKQSKKIRTALKQKKRVLKLGYDYEKKSKPAGLGRASNILKVEKFTLKSTLILMFVALRQIGCNVVFTDLMRMLRDGTLYVQSFQLLLQDDELRTISGRSASFLTSIFIFDNAVRCAEEIEDFIQYVGIKQFRYPKFEELLPKFIDELSLPKEFECLVIQMNKLFSMEEFMDDIKGSGRQWKTMAEIWVLSTIGVAMKMMFGLDDVTEKYQSQFARVVNGVMEKTLNKSDLGYKRLFALEDWFKYTEIRNTIVKHELFNAPMYDPEQKLNLTATNNLIMRYGKGNKVLPPGNILRSKDNALKMLERITAGADEIGDVVNNVSEYITIPLPKQTVMEKYRESLPNVCYPEFKEAVYEDSFVDKRIDYISHPERYFHYLEEEGYKVKVISGDARSYKGKLPKDPNILVVFKPYKHFDDYIGKPGECSNALRYVINLFNDIAIGADKYGGNKPLFHMLLATVGDLTTRKCLAGFVPMDNYDDINITLRERNFANAQKRFSWLKTLKPKEKINTNEKEVVDLDK